MQQPSGALIFVCAGAEDTEPLKTKALIDTLSAADHILLFLSKTAPLTFANREANGLHGILSASGCYERVAKKQLAVTLVLNPENPAGHRGLRYDRQQKPNSDRSGQ